MQFKKIAATVGVSALLATGVGVASATSAQAIGPADGFSQAYASRALCRSVASDLRQAHWRIDIDCVAYAPGGGYLLTAHKIKID